jgi:hypothetical protein
MEHFDDMLRNSLAGNASDSRFEFKEEYWLQAMALLELEEQKRKRRRALAYWSVLALLLIPAAICYYNRPHTHHNLPAPVQENSIPSATISNMADAKNTTENAQNQYNTIDNAPINASKTDKPTTKVTEAATSTVALSPNSNNTINNAPINAGKTDKLTTTVTKASTSTVALSPNSNNTINNAPINAGKTDKLTTTVTEASSSTVALSPNSMNRQQSDVTNNKQKNTNLKETSSNIALGSAPFNPPSTVPEQTTVAYDRTSSPATPLETTLPHFAFASFDVLPARTIAAVTGGQSTIPSLAEYDLPLPVDLPTPTTKVHKDQRFQWGVTASLGTPSGLFIDEKPGIALGMTSRFRLSRKFSINTDLIWRRWKGNRNLNNYEYVSGISDAFVADLVSNQNSVNYSFGYIATDITTSPKAFHLLELPVSLQYRIKKVALECGLDVSVRLVESIYQEQYQTTSLDAAQSLVKSGRSYQAYSKSDRFQTAILAGVHWQPTRKWSFGVRTYWNTSPSSNLNFQKSSGFNSNVLVISPTHAMTAEARVGYFF